MAGPVTAERPARPVYTWDRALDAVLIRLATAGPKD
jgi:hypothetical protein